MKKAISLVSVLVLAAGALVSCGSKDSSSEKDDKKSTKKAEEGIIGTWVPTGETLEEMKEDLGGGMVMEEAEIVFDEKNMTINASVDASELMYLTDDGFNLSGQECDVEYDGEVLTLLIEGEEVASYERIGDPDEDNMYGKYINSEMAELMEGPEMYFEFVEEGVSYMVISQSNEYTYDKEAGTVTVVDTDGEEEVSKVEFDGDDLTVTDPDGVVQTYTRAE